MRRSRSHSRKNPLDDTTLLVGGLVAAVVVGGLIYWATRPATTTAAATTTQQGTDPTSAQLGVPGWMSQAQGAAYLSGQIDANGNPIGAPALPVAAGG